MVITEVILCVGLAVGQARERGVDREFSSYVVRRLTEAESRCTPGGDGAGWGISHPRIRAELRRSLGGDLPEPAALLKAQGRW